jgi:hypothetical protein
MENSKPAIQSKTLWANLIMAALAFWVPADMMGEEVKVLIISGVNLALRYFFTDKKIEGVV